MSDPRTDALFKFHNTLSQVKALATKDSMDFGTALQLLYAGMILQRPSWGFYNHLIFVPEEICEIEPQVQKNTKIHGFVGMQSVSDVIMPWTPSQEEMAATDWRIKPCSDPVDWRAIEANHRLRTEGVDDGARV